MQPPVFDFDLAAFRRDPCPFYGQMHASAPICHVPQLGATLITRRDDIYVCEKNVEVFSSVQPDGLMVRLMGENMMRKDGEAHALERRQIFPAVSPRTAKDHWHARFRQIADAVLDGLAPRGIADLVEDYAKPVSGTALAELTGLCSVSWAELDQWSQAMIDGIANYEGNAEVELRSRAATAAIDEAISEALAVEARASDPSLLAVMRSAGMPEGNIRHNIKLAISGGQNEPRDAIAGAAHALLSHPEALVAIREGRATYLQAFEEYGRWTSPIGMSPRRIARDHVHAGVSFPAGSRAFLMFGAANRDSSVFDMPERFDIFRDTSKSIVFGSGPHFCAGAHVARALVAGAALPALFERLAGMRLDGDVVYDGWAFRGPVGVPVRW
jgi:cytochrome P450